jgi:hypothetical protein
LKLPRAKLKINLFKKERKVPFVFKYIRFKKQKIKIGSRKISMLLPYQKEFIVCEPVMVEHIIL